MAALRPGMPAPTFVGTTHDGAKVALDDLRGRYVVLYFYPRAFTPGCTLETKLFRDRLDELTRLGATVVGVSTDEQDTQCRFAEQHRVQFPLIADADQRISRAYGVSWPLLRIAQRVTFVIDPQGMIVARIHHEVAVQRHVEDVIACLQEATARAPARRNA